MTATETSARASVRSSRAMVVAADQAATQAGLTVLTMGGNAVDAAIATSAAMAVTSPHLCGMGGDLLALVYDGRAVHALNSSGRAGSGADAEALRSDGHVAMPFRHDIRSVTTPGCVDGWTALHDRFARLPLATLFGPAIRLADEGFFASPLLIEALERLDEQGREQLSELSVQARRIGDRVRRPGVAAALEVTATMGRDAFYRGSFGDGLLRLGGGWFTQDDLVRSSATWLDPLSAQAFGRTLHTFPPNSQGYLLLGSALLAESLIIPVDPASPEWAHLLIEVSKAVGRDRPELLSDDADGAALVKRVSGRSGEVDPSSAARIRRAHSDGDTTYLCVVDDQRMGVSLIQSNASNFGSWLVEPSTGINLQNRGTGFSLRTGHPAELAPGRRPPHTLTPALATNPDGTLAAVFGTMGGDGQPQITLQLAVRLFVHQQSPVEAIDAARWMLFGPVTGFDTWTSEGGPHVALEGHVPESWPAALAERGHDVRVGRPFDSQFGHAHAIVVDDATGLLVGACDLRAVVGSAAGL